MGGFVKVSLRDESGITTRILGTDSLGEFLGNGHNLFVNNIKDELISKQLDKKYLFDVDFEKRESKTPFNYGYIFIDRVNKKLFYLNNYSCLSYYCPLDFSASDFEDAKNNNYEYEMGSYGQSNTQTLDLRTSILKLGGYKNYFYLYNAMPFLESVTFTKSNETIQIGDLSFEGIIEKDLSLREKEDKYSNKISFILNWKDWDVIDSDFNYHDSLKLFEYLSAEGLLSDEENSDWLVELEELKRKKLE